MSDVTRILTAIEQGDAKAADELLPLVYQELRQLAVYRMAHEAPGQTLQPTALVHEAWLRVSGGENKKWDGRGHFFAAAAEAMRRILIDNARRKHAVRHGGKQQRAEAEAPGPGRGSGAGRRVAGHARRAGEVCRPGQAEGGTGEAPLFCRHDHRRGGGSSRHFRTDRQTVVDICPGMVVSGDPG